MSTLTAHRCLHSPRVVLFLCVDSAWSYDGSATSCHCELISGGVPQNIYTAGVTSGIKVATQPKASSTHTDQTPRNTN